MKTKKTEQESTVYLGGILIPIRDGESLEDARERYNAKAMKAYRKKIERDFWKGI